MDRRVLRMARAVRNQLVQAPGSTPPPIRVYWPPKIATKNSQVPSPF